MATTASPSCAQTQEVICLAVSRAHLKNVAIQYSTTGVHSNGVIELLGALGIVALACVIVAASLAVIMAKGGES
jgi:hypothetical protein